MAEAPQPQAATDETKDEKWAGWKEEEKAKTDDKNSEDSKDSKEKDKKREEVNPHVLLLSEQIVDLFSKLSVADRTVTHKDKKTTHSGQLDLDERGYLSLLLADVAGFKDANLAKQPVKNAICCAEFYAETFPAKVHRRVSEQALRELLTLAIRRSPLATHIRSDARLSTFAHKIPLNPNENPIAADPFTIKEIFWIIITVAIDNDARKKILRLRRRNLAILTVTICRQGSFTASIIDERLKYVHEEFKLPDLGTKTDSIEQFWKLYCKHVLVPPSHIPMLDYTSDKKEDQKEEDQKEEAATPAKDEEVDELSQLLQAVKITQGMNTWGWFFKRLAKRCHLSKTLKFFIKQLHTGGNNTVTYQFRLAYEYFDDFDWMRALNEFPAEQKRLWKALENLSEDPFFDFKKPQKVAYRDFLHLGYLGLQLQQRAGGVHSLAGFKGFHRFESKMEKKYLVDLWVRDYCISWGIDPISAIEYTRNDPTLKYANFQIPNSTQQKPTVKGDPTAKYANFKIPGNKGSSNRGGYYGYDEGYSGDYGYDYYGYDDYYGYAGGPSGGDYEYGRQLARAAGRDMKQVEYQGGYGEYGDTGLDVPYGAYGYQPTGGHSLDYYRGLRDGFLSATMDQNLAVRPGPAGTSQSNKPAKGRGRGRAKNK